MQRILKPHNAKAHRAVLQIRRARFFNSVVIDVNHIVQHAHRGANGLLQLDLVELHFTVDFNHVVDEIDRAQIAHRDLGVAGVECDLCAEVRRMHHAHVLLR